MNETKQKKPNRRRSRVPLYLRRGIWHFRMKVDGVWVARTTHTRDKEEAKTFRLKTLLEAEEGKLPTDWDNLSFSAAADKWMEVRKTERDPETRKLLVQIATWKIDQHRIKRLKAFFADKKLIHIRVADISAYQRKRLEKVAASTINSEVKLLRLMLERAECWRRIEDRYKPLKEAASEVGQPFTEKEEQKLVKLAINDESVSVAALAMLICINTGLRGGELKKLRQMDVDLINKVVKVPRPATKTKAGAREIPLNEIAEWAFAKVFTRAEALGAVEPEHYLFPFCIARRTKDKETHTGFDPTKPMVSWRTGWKLLLETAGIPHTRFHNCRHLFISKLGERGVEERVIMGLAGHVSRSMLDLYCKARREKKQKAVEMLAEGMPALPVPDATQANAEQLQQRVN